MNRTHAVDLFQPLSAEEAEHCEPPEPDKDEPVPILPVSPDAPEPGFRHPAHGTASAHWAYRDETGRLLGYVARFDLEDGKEILPRTWCRKPDGSACWRWKSFPVPRPLYGLDRLAARSNAPVLLVEGEKTADAAQGRLPGHVGVTWPGGSDAVDKADWTVLAGREVIVWPDADVPGHKAAGQITEQLLAVGAASVALVRLPPGLPEGWDLADSIPGDMDIDPLLDEARPLRRESELPHGYAMTSRGLVWLDPSRDDAQEMVLAGRFEVLAETRDGDSTSWGILLCWYDHDGKEHRLALPRASLAGDAVEARKLLLDGGLYVSPSRSARERLTAFLLSVHSPHRVIATSRIGWHGEVFVLPDGSIGVRQGEDLLLQGTGAIEHTYRERGTLEEWQGEVARYAAGNSRLVLAVSTAFAACLVGPCGAEGGGMHLRGPSSTGKTTALLAAGSVWGGGEPGGYVRSWRATSNGLEGVALGHCDTLLCLDEMSQVPAKEAGEVAYMLANGSGKSRGTRDGFARRTPRWRLLFLSSGEIGLADKIAEDGRKRRTTAGQEVRVVDIPADAGAGLGLFEELHGFVSAEALARHLRSVSTSHFGTAGRAFLKRIVGDLDDVRAAVAHHQKDFLDRYVPPGADGQVQRVAQRFALVAAGGELAVAAEVVPWRPGEATAAAARCFAAWLEARGGVEAAEVHGGIEQVRAFLQAHGMARFIPAWEESEPSHFPPRDVAGFRKREGDGWDFYVSPSAWEEICVGFDRRALAAVLTERGLLVVPPRDRHRSRSILVPGHGRRRLYHLRAAILEADDDD